MRLEDGRSQRWEVLRIAFHGLHQELDDTTGHEDVQQPVRDRSQPVMPLEALRKAVETF